MLASRRFSLAISAVTRVSPAFKRFRSDRKSSGCHGVRVGHRIASLLDVEAEQDFLIADVKSSVGYYRVRPQSAARLPLFRFPRQLELPGFLPSVGTRFHQCDRASLFRTAVQAAVGERQRAAPNRRLGPDHLAGLELLAER